MWAEFSDKLFESIWSTDNYILICAVITLFLFSLTIFSSYTIKRHHPKWRQREDLNFPGWSHRFLTVVYSLFLTLVSLFPLLGMLGTVASLLTLDLSTGNMAGVRNNFFNALTSTAWGIVFSIIFKVLNACVSDFIENQIEFSKKCSEEFDNSSFTMTSR